MGNKSNEETIEKLKEQSINYEKKYFELMGKKNIVERNKFIKKIESIIDCSLLSFMPICVVGAIASGIIGPEVILNTIPLSNLSLTLGATSLGMGALLSRKERRNLKSRFKEISKAKTNAEKIEEESRYDIEKEKVKNRKEIINDTIELLKNKEEALDSLTDKYDIKADLDIEKEKRKLDEIKSSIEEKEKKLDILTEKKTLSSNFLEVRLKGYNLNKIAFSLASGFFSAFLFNFPSYPIMLEKINYIRTPLDSLIRISPLFIGTLTAGSVFLKDYIDNKKVLKKLNNELGENKIEEKIENSTPDYNINCELKKTKKELFELKVKEIEQKDIISKLEERDNANREKNISKNYSYEKENYPVNEYDENNINFKDKGSLILENKPQNYSTE